jgi:cyclase
VGGNEELGKNGSILVSHNNTRERLSMEQFNPFFNLTIDPLTAEDLPIITFTHSITFHFNGDNIDVIHIPTAHTDGDVIVHLTNSNLIHSGDIISNAVFH